MGGHGLLDGRIPRLHARRRGDAGPDELVLFYGGQPPAGEVSGPAAWSCMSCPMMSTSPAKSSPPVQIRNQARVHLWYEQKFGSPCPPHESAEAAIDTFEATTACLGVRLQPGGRWRIYAPHVLSDVFSLVVRPNCALAPRHVYQAKTTRWRRQWPSLTVVPWPQDAG